MTGAPLPEGADCVLMQELTDSGEETVQLYAALKPLQNVVFRGEAFDCHCPDNGDYRSFRGVLSFHRGRWVDLLFHLSLIHI